MIKKLLSLLMLFSFLMINSTAFSAESLPYVNTKVKNLKNVKADDNGKVKRKDKYKTVLKYYIPYEIQTISNKSCERVV